MIRGLKIPGLATEGKKMMDVLYDHSGMLYRARRVLTVDDFERREEYDGKKLGSMAVIGILEYVWRS